MLAVPAAIACARADDMEYAELHPAVAERSAVLWHGTAWEAGRAEAQAVVAAANGDQQRAVGMMQSALDRFEEAGRPLDAERCRRAVLDT